MGSGVLFLLLLSTIGHVSSESMIKLPSENYISGANGKVRVDNGLYCDGWRLSVETNNAGVWDEVPARCTWSVELYIAGIKYFSDSEVIRSFSSAFAKNVTLTGDGKDAWVFDVDETLLSHAPFLLVHGFKRPTSGFEEWLESAEAPALPASLNLYNELHKLGFKIFLLTGRTESLRNATEANLLFAGYRNWERLILRGPSDEGKPAITYKSEKRQELVNEGYRIHGSSGDQWSDLWGYAVASRSFKLPNPMYYIP